MIRLRKTLGGPEVLAITRAPSLARVFRMALGRLPVAAEPAPAPEGGV
jgi:hypothetical protein